MIPVICATVWMTRVCFWVVLMETPALGFLFLDMISEGRLLISTLWLDKRLLAYSFISSNDSSYHVLQWINRCFHLCEMTGYSHDAMATTHLEGSRSGTQLVDDRWGSGYTIYLLWCKDIHLQTGCAHEVMMDCFISFSVAWTYRFFDYSLLFYNFYF